MTQEKMGEDKKMLQENKVVCKSKVKLCRSPGEDTKETALSRCVINVAVYLPIFSVTAAVIPPDVIWGTQVSYLLNEQLSQKSVIIFSPSPMESQMKCHSPQNLSGASQQNSVSAFS